MLSWAQAKTRLATKNSITGRDSRWQVHANPIGNHSVSGRFEYFTDPQGYETGTSQHLYEFTGTYEYKWAAGLLSRFEYRHDWSNMNFFHKNDAANVKAQPH